MARRFDSTLGFQIGFGLVLVVACVQTTYWIVDQATHSREVTERELAAYQGEAKLATRLLEAGVSAAEVEELCPHVDLNDGHPRVRPDVLAKLQDQRHRRVNRYGWEGSFFLAVLTAGLVVLSRTLRQRHRLLRMQENFVAAVSHELKSPLASIRLTTETLSLRDPPAERRRELVGRILEEVDRLETTTTNLLETRRLEEGGGQREPQRLLVSEAVGAVIATVAPSLEARGIEVQSDLPPDLAMHVDPTEVQVVLANMLDNAGKALSETEAPRVVVRAEQVGRQVRITVRDNGRGFPPHEGRRVFDKFYRVGDELRRTTRGVGLGLYLVRSLVEGGGGSVSATSEGPGQGAEFAVQWPIAG
jgi:signal transduction histidine kinase